ncbi:16S rRNA (cytosine(1402)-N(4))-methyltransferase [Neorickettsia helminthoeca str. Oregon]|uniref:Ribosomal RNA small subunit methyltransferase H n=1 Tax=Neorickettsia helminthoeca str. Oregon TaxID=1286528 RepID=X5H5D0_9RICK|nr:16S rRNA (cytosine(1402)-N(4))-methyltransferase RsmH [Neorickettsia helminthoeca]AHX11796.1 16S rRNA (cytosine(1402)-N(4))-methyltransferase [Neorickettsia helminthoeca str. Oregon]
MSISIDLHKPVLLGEVLKALSPKDGGIYVDATFGAGGYTRAILSSADCFVYAIDQDETVEKLFKEVQSDFVGRTEFFNTNFSEMSTLLGDIKVDGLVFDIGVSTMQLKVPDRGFSFLNEGPLDMRMSNKINLTAETIVNSYTEKRIADIIYQFGEERLSRKIARAIVNSRHKRRIVTTTELAEIVLSCFPRRYYKINPATKTFQALRIFINNELEALALGLQAALGMLKVGGRVIVVSFHSLEDRIVKCLFKQVHKNGFNIVTKKVVTPNMEEVKNNPSARSARMRVIERI